MLDQEPSQLRRNVVVCEEGDQAIRVMSIVQCAGFSTTPSIIFSDNEKESQAFIERDN